MSASTERLSAALVGRYRIERQLGQGGMATVYLAQDIKHDRKVALKVLKPELSAVLGADRFVVEIKTTASLQHPHILPLFDSGTADGFLYYVMPYVEGETLRDKLNRETQLGVDESVRITTEVADALDYAHRHGVIHRDIKPENILLHDGRPVVADFGIALAVSAAAGGRMTETGLSLGTPHYMSPEQATADKDITARSDIYSLASVLYEMLGGQPPHMGGSAQMIIMKIIAEPAETVTKLRKSVPPHIAAALGKALEKLPADRFDTARAFADALRNPHFETARTVAVTRPGTFGRSSLLAGAAIGAFAGAVAMWIALRGSAHGTNDASFTQHTFQREAIFNARWGADGKTILFTSLGGESPFGTDARPSVKIIRADYPEAQPFGGDSTHLLAVSSKNEVALLVHARLLGQRIFTGTLARMSAGGGAPREIIDSVQEADWSPDGSELAITRSKQDHDELEYPIGNVIYSSPGGTYISDIRVSGDGDRIAFMLHPYRYDDRGIVAIVGTKGALTKSDVEYSGMEGLSWDADGRSVLFSALQGASFEVRRWRPGNPPERALPSAGRLTMYDVRAGRWLVARDDAPWRIYMKSNDSREVHDISWLDLSIAPLVSRDGKLVAFTDQGSTGGLFYTAMLRKTDGSPAVRLGDGSATDISPDNRWVIADVKTTPQEFRLYPTGAGAHRTLRWPKLESINWTRFMPDGQHLIICGTEPKRVSRCYTSSLDGGEATPFGPDSVLVAWPRPRLGGFLGQRVGGTGNATDRWVLVDASGKVIRELNGFVFPGRMPVRWSPDGSMLWVAQIGSIGNRRVDQMDVMTGRTTPLFLIEEPVGGTPTVGLMSISDDKRSYAYLSAIYHSLLFSVHGMN